jgi:glycosyltransferase involved in cell wall biosynthesis
MQILFVHPNYPGQFGPTLKKFTQISGLECLFASKNASGIRDGVRCVPFKLRGGATKNTHYCSRTFENAVWQCHAVYEACQAQPDLKPDLIVGHSGFGTTAMLRELYDAPIINLFEYYYHPHESDMDFRPDFPPTELDFLRARMRNAMILIDLDNCNAGYSPTKWQQNLLPGKLQSKVEVIHDGVDTDIWRPKLVQRKLGDEIIPKNVHIITYISRGFEAMRGFDIFVRVANRIAAAVPNVIFACVGSDRVCYGNDLKYISTKTFREHVLLQERPDLSRFRFLGVVPPKTLAEVLSISDLHIYLTVPFVVSWSLLNALACECVVLASDTAPVREFIRDGENGLLGDFFDVDALAGGAIDVLQNPAAYRELGIRGRQFIEQHYSLDKTFPQIWNFFQRVMGR